MPARTALVWLTCLCLFLSPAGMARSFAADDGPRVSFLDRLRRLFGGEDDPCVFGAGLTLRQVEPGARDVVVPVRKREWERSVGGENAARLLVRQSLRGWPSRALAERRTLPAEQAAFLARLASDTWRGLDAFTNRENGLPLDNVRFAPGSVEVPDSRIGDYTNVTNVGLLLIANAAVFFAGLVIGQETVVPWLAFRPDRLLTQPWGLVTYMFVHGDFWHILLNMLVLFFFGPPLENQWGGREFTKYYFLCGLGGAALSFVFSPQVGLIGASAAVYGLMLAFAMNWPTAPIYIWGIFPVQARWLVAFLFVVSLVSAFGTSGAVGGGVSHLAHLGGIVAGFIYLKLDWRPGAAWKGLKRRLTARRRGMHVIEGPPTPLSPASTRRRPERTFRPDQDAEVDLILDKISREGMDSLTDAELKKLRERSRLKP